MASDGGLRKEAVKANRMTRSLTPRVLAQRTGQDQGGWQLQKAGGRGRMSLPTLRPCSVQHPAVSMDWRTGLIEPFGARPVLSRERWCLNRLSANSHHRTRDEDPVYFKAQPVSKASRQTVLIGR